MDIVHKYEVTLRNKKPNTLKERLFWPKKSTEYVRATCVINWFREQFNEEVFDIISIKRTGESMEFFWWNWLTVFRDNS